MNLPRNKGISHSETASKNDSSTLSSILSVEILGLEGNRVNCVLLGWTGLVLLCTAQNPARLVYWKCCACGFPQGTAEPLRHASNDSFGLHPVVFLNSRRNAAQAETTSWDYERKSF